MTNPPRQKGTQEESAIVNVWNAYFGTRPAKRMPANAGFDILVQRDEPVHEPIEVLSTRADRGQRLYTLRETDFLTLFGSYEFERTTPVHIESKRYKRFSLHSIFTDKFGKE